MTIGGGKHSQRLLTKYIFERFLKCRRLGVLEYRLFPKGSFPSEDVASPTTQDEEKSVEQQFYASQGHKFENVVLQELFGDTKTIAFDDVNTPSLESTGHATVDDNTTALQNLPPISFPSSPMIIDCHNSKLSVRENAKRTKDIVNNILTSVVKNESEFFHGDNGSVIALLEPTFMTPEEEATTRADLMILGKYAHVRQVLGFDITDEISPLAKDNLCEDDNVGWHLVEIKSSLAKNYRKHLVYDFSFTNWVLSKKTNILRYPIYGSYLVGVNQEYRLENTGSQIDSNSDDGTKESSGRTLGSHTWSGNKLHQVIDCTAELIEKESRVQKDITFTIENLINIEKQHAERQEDVYQSLPPLEPSVMCKSCDYQKYCYADAFREHDSRKTKPIHDNEQQNINENHKEDRECSTKHEDHNMKKQRDHKHVYHSTDEPYFIWDLPRMSNKKLNMLLESATKRPVSSTPLATSLLIENIDTLSNKKMKSLLSTSQQNHFQCVIEQKSVIDKSSLANYLESFELDLKSTLSSTRRHDSNYQHSYLDFETVSCLWPLPQLQRPSVAPFEPVLVQYSLHQIGNNDSESQDDENTQHEIDSLHFTDPSLVLTHTEGLMDFSPESHSTNLDLDFTTKVDLRLEFARKLLDSLEKSEGPIFVYSNYEKTVLNNLKRKLSIYDYSGTLHKRIDRVNNRLVDLQKIIVMCLHSPLFYGSSSLKRTLPALLRMCYGKSEIESTKLAYSSLLIQNGAEANVALQQLAHGERVDFLHARKSQDQGGTDDEKPYGAHVKEVRKALLEYCRLDTLAMVYLHRAMCSLYK
eukprot:g3296.t1